MREKLNEFSTTGSNSIRNSDNEPIFIEATVSMLKCTVYTKHYILHDTVTDERFKHFQVDFLDEETNVSFFVVFLLQLRKETNFNRISC